MFGRMKLGKYLLTVFAIVIVLSGVITAVGISGLTVSGANMDTLIEKTLAAESAVKTSRIETNVAARVLREMIIENDSSKFAAHGERISAALVTIREQIEIFKNTYGTEDGLADKYEKQFNEWVSIAVKAIEQLDNGDKAGAEKTILTECSPALDKLVEIVKEIDASTAAQRVDAEEYDQATIIFFIIVGVGLFVVVFIISVLIAIKTTKNITSTTRKINNAVDELSKGNLHTQVDYKAANEFGELSDKMNFCFTELAKYVKEIDNNMSEFANGNFTAKVAIDFLGDFENIQTSLNGFREKINFVLSEINNVSAQVYSGSEQVTSGAQILAEGAEKQASSVEELSTSISKVSEQIADNANNSKRADELGKEVEGVINSSIKEMELMLEAIHDIEVSSEGIGKIIKVIDDIAFQTNILALNAAVEAARAGSAGKGFAVVADEVRNLAQKSAEAAKNTTGLIENSLNSVKNGTKIANDANNAFQEVAQKSAQVIEIVGNIATASESQAEAAVQISSNVNLISGVVQSNSATSEESAATSEELSGQANVLNSLINQFKIDAQ